MSRKVKIIAKLETASHDGYCSGECCEYNVEVVTHIIDWIPNQLPPNGADWGNGVSSYVPNICTVKPENVTVDDFDYWVKFLPYPDTTDGGLCCSGCCEDSVECIDNDVCNHQFRYTIRKVIMYL